MDSEIDAMPVEEVCERITNAHEAVSFTNPHSQLKTIQRSRSLVLWHDHSTILGAGYILMTIHVLYDSAVFCSAEEYNRKAGKQCSRRIQEIIEEPEIYIICLSSSSPSDQVATISDRLDCLSGLQLPVKSSSEIEIHDTLHFFVGDHPAQAFERGSQLGGNYKCGSCGCLSNRMDDLAHSFTCLWRPLSELQKLVLQGRYGKKPGILKPFEKLRKAELQQELQSRGSFDTSWDKQELSTVLISILKGAQRVPTILMTDPRQSLSELNLGRYTILDSEPLHDLKGHLINLLPELPYIIQEPVKTLCENLLANILFSKRQNGYSGGDLRVALIETYKLLHFQNIPSNVKDLLSTAVQISSILYSPDEKRSPKSVLQLYNCTWLHQKLCKVLLSSPHEVSYQKLFGSYLHALVVHAPQQYEIVCLRSVNTESQERMFQQAKKVAMNTTNRKPENVIPSIMLRLQAQQVCGKLSETYQASETKVNKVATDLPPFCGTSLTSKFISSKSRSWQAHLERISSYLVVGEGVWWSKKGNSFIFHDGDHDPDYHTKGPQLKHFRSTSLDDITTMSMEVWKSIIDNKISLPTTSLRLFNDQGDFISFQECPSSPIADSVPCTSESLVDVSAIENDVGTPPPKRRHVIATSTPIASSTLQMCDESIEDTGDVELVIPEDYPEVPKNNQSPLKSKLATAIKNAIGEDPNLISFDNLHIKLKSVKRRLTEGEKLAYRQALASLQQTVLQKREEVAEALEAFEQSYYKKHNSLPSKEIVHHTDLCNKLKYIKKLLRSWNITL
jgi:hypothetical protein